MNSRLTPISYQYNMNKYKCLSRYHQLNPDKSQECLRHSEEIAISSTKNAVVKCENKLNTHK